MNILFGTMGIRVQVQNETSNRLNTPCGAPGAAGCAYRSTNDKQPISSQPDGVDVRVILIHQWANTPG
ncbi:MAG: hypothetical protein JST22_01460 [Bacteroidetes bacterium]|nr:hypothetical protein [Bacteroidota bacterium]